MSCGVGRRLGSDPKLLWLWRRPQLQSTPSLGTSICCGSSPRKGKKTKKKKKKKKKRQQVQWLKLCSLEPDCLGLNPRFTFNKLCGPAKPLYLSRASVSLQGLSFLIYKEEMIMAPTSSGGVKIKLLNLISNTQGLNYPNCYLSAHHEYYLLSEDL